MNSYFGKDVLIALLAICFGVLSACANAQSKLEEFVNVQEKKPPNRAIALAVSSSGAWAGGAYSNADSVATAIRSALEICRKQREEYRIQEPCQIYSVNGNVSSDSLAKFEFARRGRSVPQSGSSPGEGQTIAERPAQESPATRSWEKVATTATSDEIYVDRNSIRQEGDLRRMWARWEYAKPKYNSRKSAQYTQELRRYAVRCSDQTSAMTSYIERAISPGSVHTIDSHTAERGAWDFREYPPGSIGDTLVQKACGSFQATSAQPPIRRIAEAAASASWEHLSNQQSVDDGNIQYEIDRRSIRKLSNSENIVALLRLTPTRGIFNGQPYRYSLNEVYVSCSKREWSLSAFMYYSDSNGVLEQADVPPEQMEWDPALPNTPGGYLIARACREQSETARRPSGATRADKSPQVTRGFGTGWLAESGYIITAHHVVDGANRITLVLQDKRRIVAKVVTVDSVNDIAILDANFGSNRPRALPLAKSNVSLGSRVFTLGFPHPTLLGVSPKLTAGEVSSVAGLHDDPRVMQISVPVQSGNSGGPLLNMQGEVVGVISAKLSATNVLRATGDLTQNVNYAIKSRYVSGLLSDVKPRNVQIARQMAGGSLEILVGGVQDSIFIVVSE
jgi:S1-C subfamily serine protease